MFLLIVCLLILFYLFKLNKTVLGGYYVTLNPISVITLLWMIVLVSHYINFDYKDTTWKVYLTIIAGLVFGAIGFWISFKNNGSNKKNSKKIYNLPYLNKLLNYLIVIELIRLAYYSYIVVYAIGGGSWIMLLYEGTALRGQYLNYDESLIEKLFLFSTNVLAYVGYVILGIYLGYKGRNSKIKFAFIFIVELLIAVVSMSKLSFAVFLIIISVAFVNSIKEISEQKRTLKKLLPVSAIVILAFFMFIGFQRNYMETRDSLSIGVLDGIVNYFAGPTEAFRICIEKGVGIIARADHGMIDIGTTETNVYTWFYPFYSTLSYFGILIFSLIFGALSGFLYKPLKHDLFNDVASVWICGFFVFSFFDFLPKFTAYQFIFVVAFFLSHFNKKLYIRKKC